MHIAAAVAVVAIKQTFAVEMLQLKHEICMRAIRLSKYHKMNALAIGTV